jgi:outer membrane protein OmpA-like peptidoglycan-associated protein
MAVPKRAFPLLALLALCAVPAHAQITGRPVEVSGGAGLFSPDARARLTDGLASYGALGWRLQPWITLEGHASFGPSRDDRFPEDQDVRRNFFFTGLDGRWNLRPADQRIVPFVLTGAGYGVSHQEGAGPEKLERGAASLGLGTLVNLFHHRAYLRLQVRDVMFRERDATESSNHWMATAGLQVNLFGKVKDVDLDGVRDWLDTCPETPIGAKVDATGCPLDGDGDKVFDGLDKCPDTPRGCTVDKTGCPTDADGDGVCDGVDACADTPKGARVDAKGCPLDGDGDKVFDGIDECANTQAGCEVDAKGCPVDGDGDGICDGLDQCPNTPEGLKVDANGCPIEVSERETQLLDTGMIRIQDINFDTGKASIKAESFPILDEVGAILQQYPQLQIEIGGHTDDRGKKAMNMALSQLRADSVLAYIRDQFPLVGSSITTRGYGPDVPVAPNTTALGRAKNRRVEFKVLNTDALRIEREKRRFLRKDEGTPADTTRR